MPVPAAVHDDLDRYLELSDELLPGVVESVHLVGSLALDDHQPGVSDVDMVVLVDHHLDEAEIDRLRDVHRRLAPARPVDAVYLLRSDLTRDPASVDAAPTAHEGAVAATGGFEANPATWLTLRDHPFTVLGDPIDAATIWCEPPAVRAWCLGNLQGYWTNLAEVWRAVGDEMPPDQLTAPYGLAWGVLGPPRLHLTIARLTTTSKTGAGLYARETFGPAWHEVVDLALSVRAGRPELPDVPSHLLWATAAEFVDMVVADAARLVDRLAADA